MCDKGSDCMFCKIAKKEIKSTIEYEDESIIAFNDKNPEAPLHVLIIPKGHIERTNNITVDTMDLLGKMVIVANKIAQRRGVLDSGYRLVINCGKDGGQLIEHLHMHLLGGRQLRWPPG